MGHNFSILCFVFVKNEFEYLLTPPALDHEVGVRGFLPVTYIVSDKTFRIVLGITSWLIVSVKSIQRSVRILRLL